MKKLIAVIIAVLLVVLSVASLASAAPSYSAGFGLGAFGKCWIGNNLTDAEFVGEAQGYLAFYGDALVTKERLEGWKLYATAPTTVKAVGGVQASWCQGETSYELQAQLYATNDTSGWLDPDGDWIVFGGSMPDPCPLEYAGILKVGTESRSIQGEVGIIAAPWPVAGGTVYLVSIRFEADSNHYVNFIWTEKPVEDLPVGPGPTVDVPAALLVAHEVVIMKE